MCVCVCIMQWSSPPPPHVLTHWTSAVDALWVCRQCRLENASQLVSDDFVDVTEGDVFDSEQPTADPVHRVVLMHQDGVRQLVQMRESQRGVVVLDDHLRRTGWKWRTTWNFIWILVSLRPRQPCSPPPPRRARSGGWPRRTWGKCLVNTVWRRFPLQSRFLRPRSSEPWGQRPGRSAPPPASPAPPPPPCDVDRGRRTWTPKKQRDMKDRDTPSGWWCSGAGSCPHPLAQLFPEPCFWLKCEASPYVHLPDSAAFLMLRLITLGSMSISTALATRSGRQTEVGENLSVLDSGI